MYRETWFGQRRYCFRSPGAFEPFLGMQASALRGLMSVFSRLTLLCSIIAVSGLLVPPGMRVSESRAVFKHVGGSRQGH